MKLISIIILVLIQSQSSNFSTVQKQAHQAKKPLLLVFSGSDWCRPCIDFQNRVLSQDEFLKYQEGDIFYFKADFPRKKELTENQRRENESLAEQYNPSGHFPYIVLFNHQGEKVKSKKGGFDSFSELKTWIAD